MCAGPFTSRGDRCELKLGAVGIAVERRMRLGEDGRKHPTSIWEMHLTNASFSLASLTGRRNCGTPARCINNCCRKVSLCEKHFYFRSSVVKASLADSPSFEGQFSVSAVPQMGCERSRLPIRQINRPINPEAAHSRLFSRGSWHRRF